jgi:hypothetical protein
MFNQKTDFYRLALLLALSLMVAPACASQPLGDRAEDGLRVERTSSSRYTFSRVDVEPHAGWISISGEIARLIPQRGLIPGTVQIALIAADGELLAQTEVQPMRRNRQDRSAHFYARLETPATAGAILRIAHTGS